MDTNRFYELYGETDDEEMLKEKEKAEKSMLDFLAQLREKEQKEELKRELTGLESYSTTQLKAELRRRKRARKHA